MICRKWPITFHSPLQSRKCTNAKKKRNNVQKLKLIIPAAPEHVHVVISACKNVINISHNIGNGLNLLINISNHHSVG